MSEQSPKGTLVSISLHGVDLWRSDADWSAAEKARRAREAVARGEAGDPQRPAGADLSLAEQLLELPPAERERRAWAESVALFRDEEQPLLRWTFRDDSILVHLGGSWTTGHARDGEGCP